MIWIASRWIEEVTFGLAVLSGWMKLSGVPSLGLTKITSFGSRRGVSIERKITGSSRIVTETLPGGELRIEATGKGIFGAAAQTMFFDSNPYRCPRRKERSPWECTGNRSFLCDLD
jgi:hypothetical protein